MRVHLTQFVRPNGDRREVWCDGIADDLQPQLDAIKRCGLRFTCEAIYGNVSLCLECRAVEQDYDIDVFAAEYGGRNVERLEAMIRRFDESKFNTWLAEVHEAAQIDAASK